MSFRLATVFLVAFGSLTSMGPRPAGAASLVGNAFVSPTTGWVDAFPPPTRAGNWRLSLHNPTLMDTNNANPPISGAVNHSGTYEPDVLVQSNYMAPATYDLNATMRTNDDDIIGLVWNYLDPNNYFRVGIRTQAAGTFGGTQGVAVQKIVGGVLTQISPAGNVAGAPTPITQAMINNRTPFDLKVAVNGTNWAVHFNNNPVPIISGTDADLVGGRKVGWQSWAQLSDTDETPDPPFWGSELEALSVTQGVNTLYSETFAARNVPFRQLVMTNSAGTNGLSPTQNRDLLGNFGVAVNNPWIYQHSNGFLNATATAPNTDFLSSAVLVNKPGSASYSDYEMRVRIGATDNDGIGVLVRAQDDNNFYRITVHSDTPTAISTTRPPLGLSVQKVRNGVWSELYRDDQGNIPWIYQNGPAGTTPATGLNMFDLSVKANGNTLDILVTDHLGNEYEYSVTDLIDPLLTGTVGFHTWGNEGSYFTSYGGDPSAALLRVPEPVSALLMLLALGGAGILSPRRRR